MLSTGDADLLETFIESYLRTLPLATARARQYFGISGAFWPEYTHTLFGTTHPASYGCDRAGKTAPEPIWYSEDRWNHYNIQGGLDLSLFVLDHYTWTGDLKLLARFLPIVKAVVAFYDSRFAENGLDDDGKMIIFPTQAVETWQCPGFPAKNSTCVTNDTPTVAGLRSVLEKLLALPVTAVTAADRASWTELSQRVPDIATTGSGNSTKLAPGKFLPPTTSNVENPELYALHPYRVYSKARMAKNGGNLAPALQAYRNRRFRGDIGWNQVAPDAALVGLGKLSDPDAAPSLVAARAAAGPAKGYRFPAFSQHYQDYMPSADHLGMFSNALVWMVLQPTDDADGSALLLPAWPCEWDLTFKLAAPKGATVTGTVTGGKLAYHVEPAARAEFVTAAKCQ